MSYLCQRCRNKPYAQKKALLAHLKNTKTQECPATYSDISREDLYNKVKDPHYLRKQTTTTKPHNLLKSSSPLSYKKRTPWSHIEKCITRPFSYNNDPYTHWQYASEQFYNNFKDVIYVHDKGAYVEILYEKNTILVLTPAQVISNLLKGFYDWIGDIPTKFGYEKNSFFHKRKDTEKKFNETENNTMMWKEFLKFFLKYKNKDIQKKYYNESINLY